MKKLLFLSITTMAILFSSESYAFSGGIYPGQIGCMNIGGCETMSIYQPAINYKVMGDYIKGKTVLDSSIVSPSDALLLKKQPWSISNKKVLAMSLDPKNLKFEDFTNKLMIMAYILYDKNFNSVFGLTKYDYDRSASSVNTFEKANLSKVSFDSLSKGWSYIANSFDTIKATFGVGDGNVLKVGKRVIGVEKKPGLY